MAKNSGPFNPLDKNNLAESVVTALLEQVAIPLGDIRLQTIGGAGIYVIYYAGDFPAYASLSIKSPSQIDNAPIYVGKAVPSGARRGIADSDSAKGSALSKRLKDHADSIRSAQTTLRITDFFCQVLTVEDIWIPLGETLLIKRFKPLWNVVVDGFGNHNPGRGRHQGMKPKWDVLHPGRHWADSLTERTDSIEDILRSIEQHFTKYSSNPLHR